MPQQPPKSQSPMSQPPISQPHPQPVGQQPSSVIMPVPNSESTRSTYMTAVPVSSMNMHMAPPQNMMMMQQQQSMQLEIMQQPMAQQGMMQQPMMGGMMPPQNKMMNGGMMPQQGMMQGGMMPQQQNVMMHGGMMHQQGMIQGGMMPQQQGMLGGMMQQPTMINEGMMGGSGAYVQTQSHGQPMMGTGMNGAPGMMDPAKAHFAAVGYFKDMTTTIEGLHDENIYDMAAGINRLTKLKTKINELQAKREWYWTKQGLNGGAAVASVVFTFGTSLLVQGPAAVHQKNRLDSLKKEIQAMLAQINQLRFMFGQDQKWKDAEATIRIKKSVFRHGIARTELKGDF